MLGYAALLGLAQFALFELLDAHHRVKGRLHNLAYATSWPVLAWLWPIINQG